MKEMPGGYERMMAKVRAMGVPQRCLWFKADGQRCKRWAGPNGLCWTHDGKGASQ